VSDNITLPREVVKLALDHIEWYIENERGGRFAEVREAAEALRTALAAPHPEPVAYFDLQKQVFYWAKPTMIDVPMTVALKPLPLYAAPPTAAPEPTHPGYIIGSHWLETAYSRICAGEAEADVLRDCGWERVTDAEALRRDAERYRWMTEDHQENETRRRVYSVTLLFNAHRKEHIDAAIDAAMEPATEPAIGATGES